MAVPTGHLGGAGSPDCTTTTRRGVLPDRHRRHGRGRRVPVVGIKAHRDRGAGRQLAAAARAFQRACRPSAPQAPLTIGVRHADPPTLRPARQAALRQRRRDRRQLRLRRQRAPRRQRAHRRELRDPQRASRPARVIHEFTHIDGEKAAPARSSSSVRARCAPAPSSAGRCTSATSSRSRTPLARGAKRQPPRPTSATRLSGERVNYGAGSITANYDGANKHRTVIGADAHIGSNCVLVAPVTVGGARRSAAARRLPPTRRPDSWVWRARVGHAAGLEAPGQGSAK